MTWGNEDLLLQFSIIVAVFDLGINNIIGAGNLLFVDNKI